jgi:hypothetical protein
LVLKHRARGSDPIVTLAVTQNTPATQQMSFVGDSHRPAAEAGEHYGVTQD